MKMDARKHIVKFSTINHAHKFMVEYYVYRHHFKIDIIDDLTFAFTEISGGGMTSLPYNHLTEEYKKNKIAEYEEQIEFLKNSVDSEEVKYYHH